MFAFLTLSSLDLMDRFRAPSRQPAHHSYPGKGDGKQDKCSVVNTTGMLSWDRQADTQRLGRRAGAAVTFDQHTISLSILLILVLLLLPIYFFS